MYKTLLPIRIILYRSPLEFRYFEITEKRWLDMTGKFRHDVFSKTRKPKLENFLQMNLYINTWKTILLSYFTSKISENSTMCMKGNRYRKQLLTINFIFIEFLYNFERLTLPNKSPPHAPLDSADPPWKFPKFSEGGSVDNYSDIQKLIEPRSDTTLLKWCTNPHTGEAFKYLEHAYIKNKNHFAELWRESTFLKRLQDMHIILRV